MLTVKEPVVYVVPERKSTVPAVTKTIFLFWVSPVALIPPVFEASPIVNVPAVIASSNPSERVKTPPAEPIPMVEAAL